MSNKNNSEPINISKFVEKTAPITQESSKIQDNSELAKEKLRNIQIENDVKEENKEIRRELISFLSQISSLWLLFTAAIIWYLSTGFIHLSDSVAMVFITSALATVVSLWAIGLKYFFNHKKR